MGLTRMQLGREATLALACAGAVLLFSLAAPAFGTATNLTAIMRNSYELWLIALGMTLLMAMGAIDVSVGVVMGLSALLIGKAMVAGLPLGLVLILGPLAGGALGIVAGVVVVIGRIPAIVATLGLFGVFRTLIFVLLGGQWLSGLPDTLTRILAWDGLWLPVGLWVVLAAYGAVWLALRATPYGVHLLAIGNDEGRARLMGLAVRRTCIATFIVSGALCGLAGAFYVATYRNVAMTIGANVALEAIAAVILGGTAIFGGRCSLIGTLLGVLLLRIMQNGLLLLGIPSLWQTVVTGGLLLAVLASEVVAGRLVLRRRERSRA